MEVSDDGLFLLLRSKFPEEPGDEVSEENSLVRLAVTLGRGDTGCAPQIRLPLSKPLPCSGQFEQKDSRSTLDQPSTVKVLDSSRFHCFQSSVKRRLVVGRKLLDFDEILGKTVESSNGHISIERILSSGDGSLRFQDLVQLAMKSPPQRNSCSDRVDSSNWHCQQALGREKDSTQRLR